MSTKDRARLSIERVSDALRRSVTDMGHAKTEANRARAELKLAEKKIAEARKSGAAAPISPRAMLGLEHAVMDANIRFELAKIKSRSTRTLLL